MATYTTYSDNTSPSKHIGSEVIKIEKTIDWATNARGAADIDQAIKMPAGAMMLSCVARVITAEGGVATCDIGIAAGSTFHNDLDINAVASTASTTAEGYYFSADDTIDVLSNTAATGVAVMKIIVTYVMEES